jgi:hypothetical protein
MLAQAEIKEAVSGCKRASQIILEFCNSANGIGKEKELRKHMEDCRECLDFVQGLGVFVKTWDPRVVDPKLFKVVQKVASVVAKNFYM